MDNENLKKVLKSISGTLVYLFRQVLASERGINKKTGINTLTGDIYSSVRSSVDFPVISVFVKGYIDFIESGLRKGVYVPIRVLAIWASKRGIPTDNSTLYSIQRSIYKVGIPARPITDKFFEYVDEMWDKWSDELFEAILKDNEK